jgi:hypothetical protein
VFIPVSNAAPPPTEPHRHYYSPALRRQLLSAIVDQAVETGERPSASELKGAADSIGRSLAHVRRLVDQLIVERLAPPTEKGPLDGPLPHDFLVLLAKSSGRVPLAYRKYYGDPRKPTNGERPHLSTVYAWLIDLDPGLRKALEKGVAALDRYLEKGVFEAEYPHEWMQHDEMHVPLVLLDHGKRRADLHLYNAFDDCARLVQAANCCLGQHTGDIAAAAAAAGVVGWQDQGIEVYGKAGTDLTDNGGAFKDKKWHDFIVAAGSAHRFAKAHMPQERGKQERWHRSIQESFIAGLPGYLDGPSITVWNDVLDENGQPKRDSKGRKLKTPDLVASATHIPDSALLTVDQAIEAIYEKIRAYNREIVDVHKMSPLKFYALKASHRVRVSPAKFWDIALPIPKLHLIDGRGVSVDGVWYKPDPRFHRTDQGLLQRISPPKVEVRLLPGFHPCVMVGQDGKFIAALSRARDQTKDQREEARARNSERLRAIRNLLAEARAAYPENQAAEVSDGQPVTTPSRVDKPPKPAPTPLNNAQTAIRLAKQSRKGAA